MTHELRDKIFYLYRITNLINRKIYIGQTIDPEKRWYNHKRSAAQDTPVMVITSAIKKYGNQNFEFEVISCCKTQEDANETETQLVAQYNSFITNGYGYNVTLGGMNTPKTEIFKQMMRDWHASQSDEYRLKRSKQLSEATIKQIAEKGHPAAGRIVTEEEKELHRKERLENPMEYTPEIRQRMSEAHIGHTDSEKTKKVKSKSAQEAWVKRIDYTDIKCSVPDCEIHGKASYKILEGVRYCNKHGLRLLRYGRLDTIR